MDTQILGPESFKRMPWRNGGGSTLELHVEAHADYPQPIWRISMADVAVDGAFSLFTGYDRTLTLVKGNGITLHYDDESEGILDHRFATAIFKGDGHTRASLHDGPIQDFNVFCLTQYCAHEVAILTDQTSQWINQQTQTLLVYAIDVPVHIRPPDSEAIVVDLNSLLKISEPTPGEWFFDSSPVVLVRITGVKSTHYAFPASDCLL